MDRPGPETSADITVSTVHKAKGRAWPAVRIGEDFTQPAEGELGRPGRISRSEARLAYVAVTRARHQLDIGGLSWINEHPQGKPGKDQAPGIPVPRPRNNHWDRLNQPRTT
ncbi:ATP-binding domain-containing protein [Streptomyces sp. NPDC058086]|uniref:ATP-binding domain-containing protein n=1 Tax=Streptomyces sp. NPDC058086 TaxID=3346334 RepID=UPI0036E0625B